MKLKGYDLVIAIGYRKLILRFGLNHMSSIGLIIRILSDHIVADHDDLTFGIDPVYEEAEEAEDEAEDEAESDNQVD